MGVRNTHRLYALGCPARGDSGPPNSAAVFRTVYFGRGQFLNKTQNAPRPSEHPPVRGEKMLKRLGGIKGCKYKTSSWHLNGFPDGNNIGSTV